MSRLLMSLVCLAAFAIPQQLEAQSGSPDNEELARRIEALAKEIDDLKHGDVRGELQSQYGFAPAASKVYNVSQGISFGGYGEAVYTNFSDDKENGTDSGKKAQVDFLRQILYVGYKFDDNVIFNSELEFEHASSGKRGEVSVEFAFLDFLIHQNLNARAGMLLMPMGFVNELHEPPIVYGVQRPLVERTIIPSTWRANGVGVFGEASPGALEGLSYKAYVVESLSSVGLSDKHPESFSASGLRGGRQSGSKAVANDLAAVVRADYARNEFQVGGSFFFGNTGQGAADSLGEIIDAFTTIFEGHAQYTGHGVRLRGLVAAATVDDVERINMSQGLTGNQSVGESLLGWYLEGGYDILTVMSPGSRFQLVPFARFSMVDTQSDVPTGFTSNPANDRQRLTLGAAFYPHSQVVVKSDYEFNTNEAETGIDQWNFQVGFLF